MSEMMSDWQRAEEENVRTYKGVMRVVTIASTILIVLLVLMALFLT